MEVLMDERLDFSSVNSGLFWSVLARVGRQVYVALIGRYSSFDLPVLVCA